MAMIETPYADVQTASRATVPSAAPANQSTLQAAYAMPGLKGDGRRILSHGFTHLKSKEREESRNIPLKDIRAATGLSINTIQKFVMKEGSDLVGTDIEAVSIMADFLGVSIDQLITVERKATGAR